MYALFVLLFCQKWKLRYFVKPGQKFIKLKRFCFWRWLSLKKKENMDKMLFHLYGAKMIHPSQYILLSGKWHSLSGHEPSARIWLCCSCYLAYCHFRLYDFGQINWPLCFCGFLSKKKKEIKKLAQPENCCKNHISSYFKALITASIIESALYNC